MIQQTSDALKQKGVLIIQADVPFLLVDYRNAEILQNLPQEIQPLLPKSTFFIYDIAQLYDLVVKIPEIAWDIVDFAEKPLNVVFPLGKNVPYNFLRKDGQIKLRLVKEGQMYALLKQFRKPLAAIPFSGISPELLPSFTIKDFNLKAKTMQLELNGEIKFLSE